MHQSVIWRGAVVGAIIMMVVSNVSAAAGRTSSQPVAPPTQKNQSGNINEPAKPPVIQSQPDSNIPVPLIESQDKKANFETTGAVALAAIDAARHSMEESKQFYERFAWILVVAIGALTGGGFAFLRSEVRKVAEKRTTDVLTAKTAVIDRIDNDLQTHLQSRALFHKDMGDFKTQTIQELSAFFKFLPKFVELSFYAGEHGHKPRCDRPNPNKIAPSVLKVCEEVLAYSPTDGFLLALVYSNRGVANHLLGRYDVAYHAMLKSLEHDGDRPATLYNIACTTCHLERKDEAKQYLRRAIIQEPERAQQAQKDSDFYVLRDDPEFLRLIGGAYQGKSDQREPDQGKPNTDEPSNQS